MKTKLPILIIGLCFCSQLFAQPARWENSTDELIHKLQQQSREAPDLERQILKTLPDQGFGFISPEEIKELEHLLRQDLPIEILTRQLRSLPVRDFFPAPVTDQSLVNSVPITKANSKPLTSAEHAAITQVLEDFQVNDNVGRCNHADPAVAMDSDGNFVIAWCDSRNGYYNLYIQRYDKNGNKQGINSQVNDYDESPYVITSSIAMDVSGNFVITWGDMRAGDSKDIYAQLYKNDGTKQGINFRVNDQNGSLKFGPAAGMDRSGNFVICWEDRRNGDGDIYAQRYNRYGSRQGVNFRVNDDTGNSWQSNPNIALDDSSNFVITWQDERNGNDDIFAQRFSSDGNRKGTNFRVNDDTGTNWQYTPDVAIDGSGNFVITWIDSRNWRYDIYCQRFLSNGSSQGANFLVNDDTGRSEKLLPAIAIDDSGNFIITWWNYLDEQISDIYAQRFNNNGNKLGVNFLVNDDINQGSQYYPAIAADDTGNFVITWRDGRNGSGDIYCQRYASSGSTQGINFLVNDDAGSSSQYDPGIGTDDCGNFVITWQDDRNGNYDIFAQRLLSDGNRQDMNFRVNDDPGNSGQYAPVVGVDGPGNFVIVWHDYRKLSDPDIYGQRYDNNGIAVAGNFRINDDVGYSWQQNPTIAMDSSGNFIVAWEDDRNNKEDIYAQRYDKNGNKLGMNFRVTDDEASGYKNGPKIALCANGNFVITWQDFRNGNYDIYAQHYHSNGSKLGVDFRVNDDTGTHWQWEPAIGSDDSGNFVITWMDKRNGFYSDIYAQRFSSDGTPQATNFRVSIDAGNSDQIEPAIGVDINGGFVITWEDYRNGNADIYAQRYNSSGGAMGGNYRINNDTSSKYQGRPEVKMLNRYIYHTWQDNRIAGQGYDIFARVDLANSSPTAPMLLSPCDGQVVNNRRPTLEFTIPLDVDNDPLHFKLEIATNSSFADQIYGSPFESKNNVTGFSPTPPLSQGGYSCSFTLMDTLAHGNYFWRVAAWDGLVYGTTSQPWKFTIAPTGVDKGEQSFPKQYKLYPNYPNPFNSQTMISYELPNQDYVQLQIFEINGRKVKCLVCGLQSAGFHSITWNGENEEGYHVASGIYVCQLRTKFGMLQQKLIISK